AGRQGELERMDWKSYRRFRNENEEIQRDSDELRISHVQGKYYDKSKERAQCVEDKFDMFAL
ncbi:hypothetical protein chiPu_0033050, partial [Chiloscyllium punctatum]|nr:hypothetical protein [Chiloscyllium punctatum]